MPNSYKGLTQQQIERRLLQGRGQGTGSDYLPFITVRDISSKGRSHRLFSGKTGRIHHLLSDLELSVFLILEWASSVMDIREQFPLNVDDTVQLASDANIKHSEHKDVFQVMTTDFLVDLNTPARPCVALSAKYAVDLDEPRTIEKQEIERRYWSQKETAWYLVTEREIPKAVFNNINWLYPVQTESPNMDQLEHYFWLFEAAIRDTPTRSLTETAKQLDVSQCLAGGESLYWLRQLLAKRYFSFDISRPYLKLKAGDLKVTNHHLLLESYRAANQSST